MMKRLSIFARLMAFLPVLFLALLATVWFGLSGLQENLLKDRQEALKNLVQTTSTIVGTWYDKEKSGALTTEQAQKGAIADLGRLRYAEGNYYFVQRYDGVSLVHPQAEFIGKNRMDATDVDGVPTVRNQIAAARAGGGFVYYRTTRNGTLDAGSRMQKLSYIMPFEPWQWAIGTGIYIGDVDAIYYHEVRVSVGLTVLVLLAGGAIAFLLARSISHPLETITQRMTALAGGDLSITVPFQGDRHELGRLASALEVFKINKIEADRLATLQQAEQASKIERHEAIERLITSFRDRTARAVMAVVGAAGQVQSHAASLAAMATQSRAKVATVNSAASGTTDNVEAIAGAAEELSAAVSEVNHQIVRSTDTAERAVAEAERTSSAMHGLAEATQRIGAIVDVINRIAGQTNLLALNATIEAARAGESGRGFAVVATEVKALATQTTSATEEIQTHINAIQSETTRVVEAIANIGATVKDMQGIATGIASAMDQQGATTQEIARSINQAASGTRDVSANISGIAEAAETTSNAAVELQSASDDLRHEATTLNGEMSEFFGKILAA
ncbi:MAG: cache domain-containing protein [Azospirillaceae bacterium]|nr:cache domain-containing protein [Azospirillaceae bacterium]